MKGKILGVILLGITIASGCYYDNEVDLYPASSSNCIEEGVSYSADVKPILDNNCKSCHNAVVLQGDIDLDGYDKVKIFVDNSKLLSSVKQDGNSVDMPLNASKLADCLVQTIEIWINEGAPNN